LTGQVLHRKRKQCGGHRQQGDLISLILIVIQNKENKLKMGLKEIQYDVVTGFTWLRAETRGGLL
jgi:hypothetical protein